MDPQYERMFIGVAYALFKNRLHLLRLTEIVRHGIRPREDDRSMDVPPEIDEDLQQQAFDYVLTCFPRDFAKVIEQLKADWLRPA